MVSVLRTLQAEWNALVPQAQTLSIRRVRLLNDPLETIAYRRAKLEWLRGEISRLSATTALTPSAPDASPRLDLYTFGVEIEFIIGRGISREDLARAITAAGVACRTEGYGHTTGSHWKIVTDASVDSSYSAGFELVSPPMRGQDGFDQITKVCNVLEAKGCKVNKKCGLHVHVGASDWQLPAFKNLIKLYSSAEKAIDSFVAPSRRESNNTYCKALRVNRSYLDSATTMDSIAVAIGQTAGASRARHPGRYCKVNVQSFWQHGTVEFRHHQGTVDGQKTVYWVKLCLRMAAAAHDGSWDAPALEDLFRVTRCTADERNFFRGRVEFFANQVQREQQRAERARAPRSPRTANWTATTAEVAAWARGVEIDRADMNTPVSLRAQSENQPIEDNPFDATGADLQRRATTRG